MGNSIASTIMHVLHNKLVWLLLAFTSSSSSPLVLEIRDVAIRNSDPSKMVLNQVSIKELYPRVSICLKPSSGPSVWVSWYLMPTLIKVSISVA